MDNMKVLHSMALCVIALCSVAHAQEVHVTSENGVITLSVEAAKAYKLTTAGEAKVPLLTISCLQKGKKTAHSVTFSPAGILTEQQYSTFGSSASLSLAVKLGDQTVATKWVAYGNVDTFAYYGKTEQERLLFLHALLTAPDITIEFTPFLTGVPISSTFDLIALRGEFDRHPECVSK